MIKIIFILLIIAVIYKIYYNNQEKTKYDDTDTFINITNPFVDGLSQFQLGADIADSVSNLDGSDLPPQRPYNPFNPANNLIPQTSNPNYTYYPDANLQLSKKKHDNSKIISQIDKMAKSKPNPKSKIDRDVQLVNQIKSKSNLKIPCKKLNKFFMQTQFSDSYRDTLTVFNSICPDQKILFNLQTLPVTTTKYQLNKNTPFIFIKLVTQFINRVNKEIKQMPDSYEIVNNFNNYMPLTSQLKKYTENKGINKFYKDIGVDYNLYADTPPNSPIELIKIITGTREYTDAETKYIITFVVKKILKSVNDQLQITVHFVTKNDPLEGYNLFDGKPPVESINTSQQVAIEFVFTDGIYTDDFNVDYECGGTDGACKKNTSINWDDNYYSFDALGTNSFIPDYEIIKEFNKKNREHELEMNNFNINVPYPVYENPHVAKGQEPRTF
jgi:hypothetical protein